MLATLIFLIIKVNHEIISIDSSPMKDKDISFLKLF